MRRVVVGWAVFALALPAQGALRVGVASTESSESLRKIQNHVAQRLENEPSWRVDAPVLSLLTAYRKNRVPKDPRDSKSKECAYSFDLLPNHAELHIDGFALGVQTKVELPVGRRYLAHWSAPGFAPRELFLECLEAGQWIERIKLTRETRSVSWRALAQEAVQAEGLAHLLVIEPPTHGESPVHLYTPGEGTERIATLGETLSEEAGDTLVASLRERLEAPFAVAPLAVSPGTAPVPVAASSWLTRNVWWLALGAVAAGVTVAVARSSGAATQAASGVTVRVD